MGRVDSEVFRASRSHARFPNRRSVMPRERSERRAAKHPRPRIEASAPSELKTPPGVAASGGSAELASRIVAAPLTFDLDGQLSFGLSDFLLERMGSAIAIEGDRICLKAGCNLRVFASSIRQFSYQHALRRYARLTAPSEHLCELVASADGAMASSVGICLRCGILYAGTAIAGRHDGASCVNVALGSVAEQPDGGVESRVLMRTLRCGVERFRAERRSRGRSHFELDCYVSGAFLVFTWEPPTEQDAKTVA